MFFHSFNFDKENKWREYRTFRIQNAAIHEVKLVNSSMETKTIRNNLINSQRNAVLQNSFILVNFLFQTFDWTKSIQEMVLGSFFLGYCIMTFPMGLVVQRWGGLIALQISLAVNGAVSILAPWLIDWVCSTYFMNCRGNECFTAIFTMFIVCFQFS